MASLFISYSRKDKETVDFLVERLRGLGLEVWIDFHGIVGGRQWQAEITKAISECDYFLLCMSSASVNSDNVRREIDLAYSKRKPILPLRFEKVDYPTAWEYQLAGIQWIDYDSDWETRLTEALGLTGQKQGPTIKPVPITTGDKATVGTQKKQFPWYWGAVVLVPILILAYLWFGSNSLKPTPTASPTLTSAPPTDMATGTAVPLPTSTTNPVNMREVFREDFASDINRWTQNSRSRIAGGVYTHTFECPRTYKADYCGLYIPIPHQLPRNFFIALDATITELSTDGKAGIGFHLRRNGDNYYLANYYATEGSYQLDLALERENPYPLIPNTTSPRIKQDAGATNWFGMYVNGSSFTPEINGQKMDPAEDGNIQTAGDTQLVIYFSRGSSATVQIDNLTVQEIITAP